MTFSLPRKRRTTRRGTSTSSRTPCRLLAATVLLGLAAAATAQTPGESRSKFVPRKDGPPAGLAAPILVAQVKDKVQPDKTPPEKIPPSEKERGAGTRPVTDPYEAYIRLEPPGRERLFGNRDTERELEERMRQERKDSDFGDLIVFPPAPELTTEPYQARQFAATVCLAEPSYVVYRRLYFEEKNAERYGWEMGPIQPIVSTLYFLKDTALLPYNFASYPCRRFETSAGQCRPGDPVPYLCYPPELTWTGTLAEVGVIGLFFWAIP